MKKPEPASVDTGVADQEAQTAAAEEQGPKRPRTGLDAGRIALLLILVALGLSLASGRLMVGHGGRRPAVGPEVPVTALDQTLAAASNSPLMVADPTEPRFVVLANRRDAPDFGCALQLSGDGGRSWVSADPVPALPAGSEKCYAPDVAFDRDGTLYYMFVGLAGTGNHPVGVFLSTSVDRGRSFNTPRPVLGPSNFGARMALDPDQGAQGRIHLVWVQAATDPPLGGFGSPPNPIMAAHSDDGGVTFSEALQVSDPWRTLAVAPALVVGPHQRVHVTYYDLGRDTVDYRGLEGPVFDGTWSVVLASSTDGGSHFGTGTVVDDRVVPYERVMLVFTMPPPSLVAIGRLTCLAWADAREGDADVMVRCSADGGGTWNGPRRVNDDAVGNGARQYLPRLGLSPDGRLDVLFYDRRDDPQRLATQVYSSSSTDGARSFAPNVRVTSEDSNPGLGQQYVGPAAEGLIEFGSRLGVLSRRHDALLAWTDTRNSKFATTAQDIFAARVDLPRPKQPAWARVAGVVLLSIALVAGAATWRRRRERRCSEAAGA